METIKELNFAGSLLPFFIVVFIISIGVVFLYLHFQKNLYHQRLEQETMKNLHQTELLRSSIHVQEEERKRIAQDLHDELGAVLSIMRMHLLQLKDQEAAGGKVIASGLQNSLELSANALASVRSISHRLMPPQLENFGLIKTLDSVADSVNNTGMTRLNIAHDSDIPALPWDTTLGLYRIIMELVNNTIKHASATLITLEIRYNSGKITCRYTDNGKGWNGRPIGDGWGLKSIEGRVSSLKGHVYWDRKAEDGGFCIFIEIPA